MNVTSSVYVHGKSTISEAFKPLANDDLWNLDPSMLSFRYICVSLRSVRQYGHRSKAKPDRITALAAEGDEDLFTLFLDLRPVRL